jgi:hypothetical protein
MSPDAGGGGRALALIDQVLAKRPEKDDAALAACARELSVYRDALILRQRAAPSSADASQRSSADASQRSSADASQNLSHVNAVLAVVLAVHFPIDAAPWEELAKARVWLAELWAQETSEVAMGA